MMSPCYTLLTDVFESAETRVRHVVRCYYVVVVDVCVVVYANHYIHAVVL